MYSLIAVDVLHEVEIGTWKSLFIQLLRLLEAIDKSSLNTLNMRFAVADRQLMCFLIPILRTRFRQIPTFGRDTIRRFQTNISEMKQLAARDYEDILQVRRFSESS